MLITNEGKKASDGFSKSATSFESQVHRNQAAVSAPSATPKQKKVYSKPIAGGEQEKVLMDTATDFRPEFN